MEKAMLGAMAGDGHHLVAGVERALTHFMETIATMSARSFSLFDHRQRPPPATVIAAVG